jgi:hypothetical protein
MLKLQPKALYKYLYTDHLPRTTATVPPCIAIIFRRVRKISKSDYYLRHVRPSVYMKQLGSQLMDFDEIWYFSTFRKFVDKIQVPIKTDKTTGILHEGLCTFMIILRSVLRIRNVSDKRCRENQNTHFMLNNLSRKSCRLWDVEKYDTVRQATNDSIIHRMRFARFINKATEAHSEYVIFIASPRQQRLCERASMLRYTHNTALFKFIIQFFCQ